MVQQYTSPVTPTSKDPEEIPPDDGHRWATYSTYRAFVRGDQWAARALPGEVRHTYNYTRTLLRKIASYVFPAPVVFTVGEGDEDTAAEKALARVVSSLNLAALDYSLEVEASTIGDAAIKVTWDTERKRPSVVSVDPGALVVQWSPHKPHEPYAVTHAYELPGHGVQAFAPGIAVDPQQVYRIEETWTTTTWSFKAGDAEQSHPNPYGWIPYCFLRNNPHPRRFWGQSDVPDLIDVARELNREMTTLGRIMEMSGAPIAVLEGVNGSEGIHSRPGAKWELPEGAKAYLLDLLGGAGVALHTAYIDQLRTNLHDLSETPRTAFGDSGRDLSGAALEVEIQPLVQRVRRKQRSTWDPFYDQRNRRILSLLDQFDSSFHLAGEPVTETIWPPILPSDEDSTVLNMVQRKASGLISRYSALERLGVTDPDKEIQRIEEDQQAAARHEEAQQQATKPAIDVTSESKATPEDPE